MENFTNWCIIVLLIIAILYALILNFRLSSFKSKRKEIQKTIHSFNQVVQNAETTLSQIQKRTQNIAEQLKEEINKATQLRDDLVLILDKTNHTTKTTYTPKEKDPAIKQEKANGAFAKNKQIRQGIG